MRDMTQKQFERKMRGDGFEREGFMGYWKLPPPHDNTAVSCWNAGSNRRAQLAYMLKKVEEQYSRQGTALAQKES